MRRVLIVESKGADARALKESLREAGLLNTSLVIKNTAEAKRHLAERHHDCIILLNIHGADGEAMPFLDWLREQGYSNELLVIAVGERNQLRTVAEACNRGAHSFVMKPVHVEDLKALARTYPDHWAQAAP